MMTRRFVILHLTNIVISVPRLSIVIIVRLKIVVAFNVENDVYTTLKGRGLSQVKNYDAAILSVGNMRGTVGRDS